MKKWPIWFVILLVALAACGGEEEQPLEPAPVEEDADVAVNPLSLTSPAFGEGEEIPVRYTCDGDDVPPPLTWQDLPAGVGSYTLIVDDPDAPRGTWDHWIVYNIPPDVQELPEETDAEIGVQGMNSWTRTGYGGPCPPVGRHRYFHKLYALDTALPDMNEPSKLDVEQAMEGHVIGEAVLMGTYEHH